MTTGQTSDALPPVVAVVGRHRRRQDRAVPGPGRGAGRRDREHRRHAGLPRHGRRHRQAARRGAARHPAPPARPARGDRAGDRRGVPAAGAGGRRRLPGTRQDPGAGRRLRALHPCGARPLRLPGHGSGRCVRAGRPSWPSTGRRRCTVGSPRSTGRPRPGSSRSTAAAWCGRSRSSRSPAVPSPRRCPSRRTSTSAPCRSGCGSRGRCSTSGSSSGCERMWEAGLVEEVRRLAAAGLRDGRTAHRALGYQQVLAFLDGECTEEEAVSGPSSAPAASRGGRSRGSSRTPASAGSTGTTRSGAARAIEAVGAG